MSLQDDLIALETGFWTGGPDMWHRHCDESCLVAFASMAGPMAREAIAATAEEGRWRDLTILPRGLALLGEDVAILTYEASAVSDEDKPHHAVVSSAYVRRPDGWKLAFHQQTEKAPEGEAPPAV